MPEYSILVKLLLNNADTKTIQSQLTALGKTLKIEVTPELDPDAKAKIEAELKVWQAKLKSIAAGAAKITPTLDEAAKKKLENQWTRWQNKLSTMKTAKPEVFSSTEVQSALANFDALEGKWKAGEATRDEMITSLNHVTTAYSNMGNASKSVTHDGYGFGQMLTIAIKKMLLWGIAGEILFGTLKKINQGFKYIQDLNKELVNLQVVTGATYEEVRNISYAYNDLASRLGATTLDVAKGKLKLPL